MNAPVPPVNEPETLKQQNQYQASYNQSFSSQPHQVEQSDLQQEQLQTGKLTLAKARMPVASVEQMIRLWSPRWCNKTCHVFLNVPSLASFPLNNTWFLLFCLSLNTQQGVKFST